MLHNNNFMFLILISLLLTSHLVTASDSEVDDGTTFTYSEDTGSNGPNEWGKTNPEWKVCNNGKLQSPIDIVDKRVQVSPNLGVLETDYKPSRAVLRNRGHDIQLMWKGYAGKININGTNYNLTQCHWHSPSEHTFNGKSYNLELHAVHVNSHGNIAVVGILYKYGHPDRFLSKLLPHIKSTEKEGDREVGIVSPGDIKFGSRKYYRYIGSLTVPPCTEGVVWTIVKKVRTVSREQVKALREAVYDGFETNTRPIQQSNGRPVLLYTPRDN